MGIELNLNRTHRTRTPF